MADDKKISELPLANTPLAGTEETEVLQGGVNKRTAVSNIGTAVSAASESTSGIAELATQAETNTGTDDLRIVTPLKFNTKLRAKRTVTGTGAIVQTDDNSLIIFNSATPFNFTLDQLTADSKIKFVNYGLGAVTFVNGSGVTLVGYNVLYGASGTNYPRCEIVYDSLTSPRITFQSYTNVAIPQGVLFTDDFVRANGTPGANYTVTVTTGTIAIVSNKLNLVGPAAGGFGNYLTYDGLVSCIRDASFEVTYTAQNITATSYGLFVGLKSTSGINPVDVQILISQVTGANNGMINVYRNTALIGSQSGAASLFTIAAGNKIRVTVYYTEIGLYVGAYNVTTGTENNFSFNLGLNTGQTTPNVFKHYLGSVGGTQDVEQLGIAGAALKNTDFCFLGSSILQGYGPRITFDRWLSKLMKGTRRTYTPMSIQSGRTSEFLQVQTEALAINADVYVLCELMGNDISTGVSSVTWQANYATLVTAIKAAGKRVIHTAPVPRNATDQSGGLSYLQATYPNDIIIDHYTPLLGSGTAINIVYGSGDGTHPGDTGNALMATIAANAFPAFIK